MIINKKISLIITISFLFLSCNNESNNVMANNFKFEFNETNAYNYIKTQTDLGPRNYGSVAHNKVRAYFKNEMSAMGYTPLTHTFKAPHIKERAGENIYAFLKGKSDKYIVIASHYDSRSVAEKDANRLNRNKPIIGANDGASSSGVLLELMRAFKSYQNSLNYSIVFILFDLEDDGNLFEIDIYDSILSTDWIQGSIAFVNDNVVAKEDIAFGILLDMVGASNASFKFESYAHSKYSAIYNSIWESAKHLGYTNYFIDDSYGMIIDDHTPFIENNIPFIDIIDMDYKYHHTHEDTIDKMDLETIKAVGRTIEYFIFNL